MALWFLAPAAGQAITAQLVQATASVSDTVYFGGIGLVALAFAGLLALLGPWVTRNVRRADRLEGVHTAGE
jgi:POT family proton-dependent oligopeptide transporter